MCGLRQSTSRRAAASHGGQTGGRYYGTARQMNSSPQEFCVFELALGTAVT